MWSQTSNEPATVPAGNPARDKLLLARMQMADALRMLDAHSLSPAAASLDMAIHYLDRELSGG